MSASSERPGRRLPPAVFVHGYSCSASHWAAAPQRLGEQTEVAVLSLPGHDEGPLPADGPLDVRACAEYVTQWVEAWGRRRVAVVGHSLGGMVGMVCAAERSDLFAGLVLVDSFPRLGPPAPFSKSYWRGSPPDLKSRLVREMMQNRKRLPATLWESIVAFDGTAFLARVGVPIRGIYGDRGEGGVGERLAKSLLTFGLGAALDVALHLVENAGHFVMLEQPEVFWPLLRRVLADLTEGALRDG